MEWAIQVQCRECDVVGHWLVQYKSDIRDRYFVCKECGGVCHKMGIYPKREVQGVSKNILSTSIKPPHRT